MEPRPITLKTDKPLSGMKPPSMEAYRASRAVNAPRSNAPGVAGAGERLIH